MATFIERYSYIYSPFIKESYPSDEAIFRTTYAKTWVLFFAVVIVAVPPFLGDFHQYFLSQLGIAVLAAMGINILTGYTGLISLGHAAFIGVGAYTYGNLINHLGFPFWLAILGAGFLAALLGLIIGVPALRIKGIYLAIATLAFQFICDYTFVKWKAVTGGSAGINIPSPSFGSWVMSSHLEMYYIVLFFVVLGLWCAKNLFRSKYGRALMAIRDNDVSAEVAGIPVFKYKILSFVVSSFYAGMAGALWGILMRSSTPLFYGLDVSVNYLAMVIIGGLGTIVGSVLGAIFLVFVPEFLNWMVDIAAGMSSQPADIKILVSPVKLMALGGLIIFFIHVEPTGLAGVWRRIRDYLRIWPLPYV
ncbi:MAG: branched-chain amino acid ABC transporter permease [Deltaproteobacteria bacterium]|nr:branched-chain amino acid ABC transporter permease [Deltaproteobacteria bacterium]MBW1817079.1 branched-chain amino acid ABC transporter permease [Deltaproteobacteria bacterium]MBW2284200.1 branched-chain amino acid ABC transporter permease [Deltaproteobacteria bacterium]